MNRLYKRLAAALCATLGLTATGVAQSPGSISLAFNDNHPDHVVVPMASPTGAFTLEAWVKYEESSWANYSTILEFHDDQPWFGVSGGVLDVYGVVSGGTVSPWQWTHVAYTWDGSTSRLYLNGVQTAATNSAPSLNGSGLSIGGELTNSFGWHGKIDEVMVWGTARTAAQLQADRQGYLSAQPGMLAYFPFNENAGQVAGNLVPGAPNGTLGDNGTVEIADPSWAADVMSARQPASFTFEGSAPNPFREQTTVNFRLTKPGPVHLAVYDATGRLVSTLVDERRPAGTYAVPFNAAPLPAGLYTCRLSTDGHTISRRLVRTR